MQVIQRLIISTLNHNNSKVIIMIIHSMKIFGSNDSSGNLALVIGNDSSSNGDRLKFAFTQNKAACVFIEQDNNDYIVLDYYYPHARSPLCIDATLAAGYIYFTKKPHLSQISVVTAIHKQKMRLENRHDGIFLRVAPEIRPQIQIENQIIEKLLNLKVSNIISQPIIASVGSPKLLVEVDTIETLNNLSPNLESIANWGIINRVNGCYVYCQMPDKSYHGRNFNHLNTELEDVATGVAAGALTAYLKKDIDIFQGTKLNNRCIIHTKYLGDNILIGGNVKKISKT